MIIQSKFRDYYDNCVGFGIDKAIIYKREDRILNGQEKARIRRDAGKLISQVNDKLVGWDSPAEYVYLGFCGKIYVGIMLPNEIKPLRRSWQSHYDPDSPKIRWKAEDLLPEERGKSVHKHLFRSKRNVESLEEWFKKNEGMLVIDCPELFFEHELVSFVLLPYREANIIVNPLLKKYSFQKLVDGQTAFQEIAMHVASLTSSKIKQPEPINDKLKAKTKGFDERSFRNMPRS